MKHQRREIKTCYPYLSYPSGHLWSVCQQSCSMFYSVTYRARGTSCSISLFLWLSFTFRVPSAIPVFLNYWFKLASQIMLVMSHTYWLILSFLFSELLLFCISYPLDSPCLVFCPTDRLVSHALVLSWIPAVHYQRSPSCSASHNSDSFWLHFIFLCLLSPSISFFLHPLVQSIFFI